MLSSSVIPLTKGIQALRRLFWIPVFTGMTVLSSCGFHLPGDPAARIKSLTVTQVGASQVAAEIRRTLSTGPTRLVPIPGEAEAHLRILQEVREKSIYTLTGAGRVYEFQLRL